MQIQITDDRIEQNLAVAPENIQVSLSEASPQTFQTINEKGDVEVVTLNVMHPVATTTLKDEDAAIDNIKIELSQAQERVDSLTAELAKRVEIRASIQDKIGVARGGDGVG